MNHLYRSLLRKGFVFQFQGATRDFAQLQHPIIQKSTMENVNVLTSTASELQALLSQNKTNSVELVKLYLNQIEAHNKDGLKLNAIISIAPRDELLAIATSLDAERAERGPRGPLHGIPVIVKVCAAT